MTRLSRTACRALTALMLTIGTGLTVRALDLPVKDVNGKTYYYYTVQKGETVYSLTHRFGVTYEDMLKYNPWISEGLKHGKTLYFPTSDFSETKSRGNTIEHRVKRGETIYSLANRYSIPIESIIKLNPGIENGLKKGEIIVIPTEEGVEPLDKKHEAEVVEQETETATHAVGIVYEESPSDEQREFSVAIMLPFALDESKPGKSATYATDFYRGFLLGIDSLRSDYGNPVLNIRTIDTGSADGAEALTKNSASLRMMDLIVAPDNADRLAELNRFGEQNQIYILNNFQARDTQAKTNQYALQGNILQAEMFDKAIDYFIEKLDGGVPVFLDNTKGAKDKEQFVKQLTERLNRDGIPFRTLTYSGSLTDGVISDALEIENADYVFVPMSGSLTEFNKFATALKKFQKESSEYASPGRIRLFGYPEYTRFSNDAFDDISRLNTTFYTRFYNDSQSGQNDRLNASFYKWFGNGLPDGVPNQALYGFDTARFVLGLASKGEVTPETILSTRVNTPSQQAYIFRQEPDGGFVNDALFFVTVSPGAIVKTELR